MRQKSGTSAANSKQSKRGASTISKKSESKGKASAKSAGSQLDKVPPAVMYRLSDPKFIDMGWTVFHGKQEVVKVITYGTTPAKPNTFWDGLMMSKDRNVRKHSLVFPVEVDIDLNYYRLTRTETKEHTDIQRELFKTRSETETKLYEDGGKFAEFHPNGNAKVYYPNGYLALYLQVKEAGFLMRLMQPGGKDQSGVVRTPTAAGFFDSMGNGVVYDLQGQMRLNFTQRDGILRDTPSGLPFLWKWPALLSVEYQLDSLSNMLTREEIRETSGLDTCISDVNMSAKDFKKSQSKPPTARLEQTDESQPKGKPKGKKIKHDKVSSEENHSGTPVLNKGMPFLKDSLQDTTSGHTDRNKVKASSSGRGKASQMTSVSSENKMSQSVKTQESSVMDLAARLRTELLTKRVDSAPKKHEQKKAVTCTPMKPLALAINPYLSLRITDQANISLQFRYRKYRLRFELGVIVDPAVQIGMDLVDPHVFLRDVPCRLEPSLVTASVQSLLTRKATLAQGPVSK